MLTRLNRIMDASLVTGGASPTATAAAAPSTASSSNPTVDSIAAEVEAAAGEQDQSLGNQLGAGAGRGGHPVPLDEAGGKGGAVELADSLHFAE